MKKSNPSKADPSALPSVAGQALRLQAEARLSASKRKKAAASATKSDTLRLVHELQVHKIELEMQNEELIQARAESEAVLLQYTDLYDFAPVGYFSLTRDGVIRQVNLTGAALLGLERGKMFERRLGLFISTKSRPAFTVFLEKVFSAGGEKEICEVELLKGKTESFWARVDATMDKNGETCRAVVADITERKQAEEALRESSLRLQMALDSARIGIHEWDVIRNQFIWDDRIYEFWGLPAGTPIDLELFTQGVHPDDRARVQAAIDPLFDPQGDGNYLIQYRVIGIQTGIQRWLELSGKMFFDNSRPVRFIGAAIDITERKRAEDALRLSELELKTAQSVARVGSWKWDIKRSDVIWSDEMYRIFGIDKNSYTGRLGDVIAKVIHTDDLHIVLPSNASNIANKPVEYRIILPDKSIRHIWAKSGEALMDGEGKPIFLTGIAQDITERKRAEDAVLASEERFHTLFQTLIQGVVYQDADGRIISANPAAERILGLSLEQMQGLTSLDPRWHAIHEDGSDFPGVTHPAMLALRSGQPVLDVIMGVFQSKTGNYVWININAMPLFKPGEAVPHQVHTTFEDITARKHAEEALRESEKAFKEYFNIGTVGMCVTSLQKGWVEVNDCLCRMLGYSRDELTRMTWAEITHPDDLGADVELFDQALAGARDSYELEKRFICKNGQIIHTLLYVNCQRSPDGSIQHFLASLVDITERRQREREWEMIAKLSAALRVAPSRAEILPLIAEQIVNLLNCDSVAIEIVDPLTGDVIVEDAQGMWKPLVGLRQEKEAGINALISRTLEPYHTNDFENDSILTTYPQWARAGMRGGAGVPLIAQEKLIGFIWIGRKKEGIIETEIQQLSSIANMAANAIHRTTLYEQTLKDTANLTLAYDTTLEGWAHALEMRDQETEGHTRRVVKMTLDLARIMGISEDDIEEIRRGALLHDIGKMGIPDAILLKPDKLTEREWEIMYRHPEYAYKLLSQIDYLKPALDIPWCHHEKWDGSGYPRSLTGEEIPIAARIFAIIDVWDALTSDRPYRAAWSKEKALEYIRGQSGKHFDPRIVDVFLKAMKEW